MTGLRNDRVSSVKVGADVQAVLCRDNDFRGNCQLFTTDESNLGGTRIGNDRVSSAKVQPSGFQECEPRSDEAAFFQHRDFLAPCVVLEIGDYPNASAIGLGNDSITSILVGPDVQAVLCRDSGFGGDCELFKRGDNNLGGTRIGNDRVSSAKVQPSGFSECEPDADQVAFFQHRDFLAPCVVLEIGDYPNASAIGLNDNSISAIKVGATVQACACVGEDFKILCGPFTADEPNLSVNFPQFHDLISSVKVQARGAECRATS